MNPFNIKKAYDSKNIEALKNLAYGYWFSALCSFLSVTFFILVVIFK